MNDRSAEQSAYQPHPSAFAAAEVALQPIYEANGNPEVMTLDRENLTKIVAYAIDCAIKGAGVNWK